VPQSRFRWPLLLSLLLILHGPYGLSGSAQSPSLREVLRRAGSYVEGYQAALAGVVADERYVQEARPAAGGPSIRRELRAEFALVRLGGDAGWTGFRDVIEVDGRRVHDRQGRLLELFTRAPGTAAREARRIADESARYNLGGVRRNFNEPTVALAFLAPTHQPRFRFRVAGDTTIAGLRVRVVRYDERRRGSFIRTPEGRDIPARGLLFVDPESGRVVRTELQLRDFVSAADLPSPAPGSLRIPPRADVVVTFQPDEGLGVWVPAVMHEIYTGPWSLDRLTGDPDDRVDLVGTASYSNYRRFVTDVRILK
jgi:hypothetical protein